MSPGLLQAQEYKYSERHEGQVADLGTCAEPALP